jgi:hypothetical protein
MIVLIIIVGLLLILLTLPARIFGDFCGMVARVLTRDRSPPLPQPPPI